MLTKEESAFIDYWEKNRMRRKKAVRQFLLGIPIGLLFVVPILLNLMSGWYKRANMEANSPDFDPRVLVVALLLIVAFTSIFWQRHKWDQYEQRYLELIARRDREARGPGNSDKRVNSPGTGNPNETSDSSEAKNHNEHSDFRESKNPNESAASRQSGKATREDIPSERP